jgi:hypothetical protein
MGGPKKRPFGEEVGYPTHVPYHKYHWPFRHWRLRTFIMITNQWDPSISVL